MKSEGTSREHVNNYSVITELLQRYISK
jgi:hypothetical protein